MGYLRAHAEFIYTPISSHVIKVTHNAIYKSSASLYGIPNECLFVSQLIGMYGVITSKL